MYAIVETGGKQYQVEEGRYIDVELLEGEADSKIVFDKVVMIVNGKKSKVGQPYVSGASAEGKIIAVGKDGDVIGKAKKIIVYKQRPKKGYRRKQGHRQDFTRVMISKIRTSAQKKSAEAETEEA
jgi:large subunit ribosomal protein L21